MPRRTWHSVDGHWLLSLSFALTRHIRRRPLPRPSVRLSFSQLPPPSAPACQLGALTSSPSSSRRRSIYLLGWQVSMQLFAALHIGRTVFPKLDPPTMPGKRGREATDTGEERGSEAVGPVRPAAVRCSGSAVHAALVHSCRPEVHKNLKWAKVRWRLDMRGGLCCRPGRGRRARSPLARLASGCPRCGRRRRRAIATRNEYSAISEFHLSSPVVPQYLNLQCNSLPCDE